MRLDYRLVPKEFDRAKLKPAPGDMVLYEGRKYKVTVMGLRWLNMIDPETNKEYAARVKDVVKVMEEETPDASK
jgi:hypothetical protein